MPTVKINFNSFDSKKQNCHLHMREFDSWKLEITFLILNTIILYMYTVLYCSYFVLYFQCKS